MARTDVDPILAGLNKKQREAWKDTLKAYDQGQSKKGMKAADTILKLKPNHGPAIAMKAWFMYQLAKSHEARQEALLLSEKAIKVGHKPPVHHTWSFRGMMLREENKTQAAVDCLKKACEIDAENVHLHRETFPLLVSLLQFPQAKKAIAKYMNLLQNTTNPMLNIEAICLSTSILFHLGEFKNALGMLTQVKNMVELVPKATRMEFSRNIHNSLILLMFKSKQYDDVIKTANEYIADTRKQYTDKLETSQTQMKDIQSTLELKAKAYVMKGDHETGMKVLRICYRRNPACESTIKTIIETIDTIAANDAAVFTAEIEALLKIKSSIELIRQVAAKKDLSDETRTVLREHLMGFVNKYVDRCALRGLEVIFTSIEKLNMIEEVKALLEEKVEKFSESVDVDSIDRLTAVKLMRASFVLQASDNCDDVKLEQKQQIESALEAGIMGREPSPSAGHHKNDGVVDEKNDESKKEEEEEKDEKQEPKKKKVFNPIASKYPVEMVDHLLYAGQLLRGMGYVTEAIFILQEAHRLSLDDRYVLTEYIHSLGQGGNIEKALEHYSEFTKFEAEFELCELQNTTMMTGLSEWSYDLRSKTEDPYERLVHLSQSVHYLEKCSHTYRTYSEPTVHFHLYCARKGLIVQHSELLSFVEDIRHGFRYGTHRIELLKKLATRMMQLKKEIVKINEMEDKSVMEKLLEQERKIDCENTELLKMIKDDTMFAATQTSDLDACGFHIAGIRDGAFDEAKFNENMLSVAQEMFGMKGSKKNVEVQQVSADIFIETKKYMNVINALKNIKALKDASNDGTGIARRLKNICESEEGKVVKLVIGQIAQMYPDLE